MNIVIKKIINIILAIILILPITSCSSKKDSVEESSGKGPINGGTINIFSTTPDTLNPLYTNNPYVKNFLEIIFEGLVSVKKNHPPKPCLAKSWNVSSDKLTWTFYLRDGIYWHDGIPLTSEDVEFTFNLILDNNYKGIYKKNLENIAKFSAIDLKTFKITLNKPNSFITEQLNLPIISKHFFLNEDIISTPRNMTPLGTGPYEFLRYDEASNEIILKRNSKWWNSEKSKTGYISPPYIEEIKIKIYPDAGSKVSSFLSNDIDVISSDTEIIKKFEKRSDITIKKYANNNWEFIAFNTKNPSLIDKSIRQAITFAIDKDEIINNISPGNLISAYLPIIPDSWIMENSQTPHTFNQAIAKELLLKSGCTLRNNIMYKNNRPLNFTLIVNNDNETRLKVAEIIKNNLKQIGVNLKILKVSWSYEQKLINNGQFEMAILGYKVPHYPDISFMYSSKSKLNISGFSDAKVDEYLDKIKGESDFQKRKDLFSELNQLINNEIPYLGLYFGSNCISYNKKIQGSLEPSIWMEYNDISKWYKIIM